FIILFTCLTQAQYIGLKTVPVVTGNQFLIFPSQNAGMGFVSIAVEDPLGDPFNNPAKKGGNEKSFIYGTPVVTSPSTDDGQTNTIPLGYRFIGENWYGTLSTAIQRVKDFGVSNDWRTNSFTNTSLNGQNNLFAFGSIGKSTGPNDYVGFSVLWAGLDGMQGVNLLYPRSSKVDQSGYLKEFRLGTVKNLKSGESFETVFLRHEISMKHEVTYNGWEWWGRPSPRVENNKDHTITNGVHFKYIKPFRKNDQIGFLFTYNRKEHPKIPNYELMNIPRDPGETDIINIGIGLSERHPEATLGIDLIYEPARSHTWAEAAQNIERGNEPIIYKGAKTVDNKFKFENYRIKMGTRNKTGNDSEFLFGLSFYKVRYSLKQIDYIVNSTRTQDESWLETMITWGIIKRYKNFNLYYNGNITLGTGLPSSRMGEGNVPQLSTGYTDFMVAPSGSLMLDEIYLITHQLTLTTLIH
ncbi:hypothetical protein JYT44_03845, partial [Caldithrix abyssi]|nr:hypothetical protein [Caldithrix abyssi]